MNDTTTILLSLALIILIIFLTDFKLELKFTKQKKDKKVLEKRLKLDTLSNTEIKVLKSLSEGKSNKEIANDFSISVFTAKKHVSNIFKKLGITTRIETRQFSELIEKEMN